MTPERRRSYLFLGLLVSACIAVVLVNAIDRQKAYRLAQTERALRATQMANLGLIHEREVSDGFCTDILRVP